MDKIYIQNLNIYAYHGVLEKEKQQGQSFLISAELSLDLRGAAFADELEKTVNYAEVCALIERTVTEERCDLIEAVAENICNAILLQYSVVQSVRVRVSKPEAPIAMDFETVAVELERARHRVYLSIGSNLGDREGYLNYGVDQLGRDDFTRVCKVSQYRNTEPYGEVDQPDFLNGALEIETLYSPEELLAVIHDIEKDAGRERIVHWGPRTLDIDILLYDDLVMSTEQLRIPHVELEKRSFVLEPLCEIAPHVLHPTLGKSMQQLLTELGQRKQHEADPYLDPEYRIVDRLSIPEGGRVVFAGVPGAYAETAMFRFFGNDISSYGVRQFEDVVNEVCMGKAAYGVIPIENSSAGFVSGSYDIIRKSGVKIVGEVILDIEHALLGLPEAELSDIRKVYSHPQGLMQCKEFIDRHDLLQVSVDNTARAAKKVKESGCIDCGAIASERAAELYGLKVLARRINFSSDNSTRFAVVSAAKQAVETSDHISICFTAPHKCGSLYHIMGHIMENGLNMTSIESRPSLKKKWEYYFYVSLEGKLTDKGVARALGAIQAETEEMIILGTY
jgi:2-amino-4-hydroxy-6-hydroxymethyldihydropteridine diphosphokinase/dihydroneopterin aldolase